MSVKIIEERLASYQCRTNIEEQHALREITQEIVLAALGRGDFFKQAIFQGGTCLRIFYGLNRFSEDMDFILKESCADFSLKEHIGLLSDELSAYGYNFEITERSKADATVKKAFLKDESLGKVINLRYKSTTGRMAMLKIKLEVDTNPPAGGSGEIKYLDFPFVSSVYVQDKPSLFAGKLHALLCRSYLKGRDWYDFLWYCSNAFGVNYAFLSAALNQNGPWQGRQIVADKNWLVGALRDRVNSIDIKQAADDVRSFVKAGEQKSLELWSRELFASRVDKLSTRL